MPGSSIHVPWAVTLHVQHESTKLPSARLTLHNSIFIVLLLHVFYTAHAQTSYVIVWTVDTCIKAL